MTRVFIYLHRTSLVQSWYLIERFLEIRWYYLHLGLHFYSEIYWEKFRLILITTFNVAFLDIFLCGPISGVRKKSKSKNYLKITTLISFQAGNKFLRSGNQDQIVSIFKTWIKIRKKI